jgi:enterochelin esterase-like enzyme
VLFTHVRDDGSAEFHYPGHDAHHVAVTGSFCGWRTPGVTLERTSHGFRAEVSALPMGDVEYKFVVDGRWVEDPINLSKRKDGSGGHNSLLHRGLERGAVHHLRFHSPALGSARGYVVYLPPVYATSSTRRFPVLHLLHGALDWERTWIEKGDLASTMDRLRADGAIGDLVVVMPSDNGDLYRGDERIADYLARDVVGHVDYEFRTLSDARHRALDGLSTGGFTSLAVGMARADVFRSIGSMSGSIDRRTFELVERHAAEMRGREQRYRISCGLDEPNVETSRAVCAAIARAGVHAEHAEAHGTHDWPLWRDALAGHVRFHWRNVAG